MKVEHMFKTESEFTSDYIGYGVRENITIGAISLKEDQFGVKLVVPMTNAEGKKVQNEWSLKQEVSEGKKKSAAQVTMGKVTHLWNKYFPQADLDVALSGVKTNQDLATLLNSKLKGKVLDKVLFRGKEIAGKEGKANWWKAEIGFAPFASTAFAPANLVFSNTDHLTPLATNSSTSELSSSGDAEATWGK